MTDHPFLPGRIAPGDLADMPESWPVASTSPVYSKPFLSIRTDEIVDDSGSYDRVIVEPKGAVGVVGAWTTTTASCSSSSTGTPSARVSLNCPLELSTWMASHRCVLRSVS